MTYYLHIAYENATSEVEDAIAQLLRSAKSASSGIPHRVRAGLRVNMYDRGKDWLIIEPFIGAKPLFAAIAASRDKSYFKPLLRFMIDWGSMHFRDTSVCIGLHADGAVPGGTAMEDGGLVALEDILNVRKVGLNKKYRIRPSTEYY